MNTPESFDEIEREFRFNTSAQAAKEAPTSRHGGQAEGGRYKGERRGETWIEEAGFGKPALQHRRRDELKML
jgi:hypothetical protein